MGLDEDVALRFLLQGTARATGEEFFRELVKNLAGAFGTLGAWVTEFDPAARRLKALAFHLDGQFIPWEASIDGTPCAQVVEGARLIHLPDRLLDLYPGDPDIRKLKAVSYMGVPLQDAAGQVLGHLAVLDTRPMPEEPRLVAVLQLFAERAAAELSRVRAEEQVRASEAKIRSLSREATYLREELRELASFEEILGESRELVSVLHEIEQVAGTDATVLVLGETGTGKELVARAIHRASRRRDAPLVRLNCAAIPAALIESELFGHEKGAFTGATDRREGRFALADGGTIFLDEIGELSPELQAKLLRVLQDGEFEPVGGSRTRKVDVRVISATNRNLARMMESKTFREDLYFRLSVFPLELPPLRRRGRDVLLLAEHFAGKFARKIGRRVEPIDEGSRRRLLAYAWPGNVRELANVIERAVITSPRRAALLRPGRAGCRAGGAGSPEGRRTSPHRVGGRGPRAGEPAAYPRGLRLEDLGSRGRRGAARPEADDARLADEGARPPPAGVAARSRDPRILGGAEGLLRPFRPWHGTCSPGRVPFPRPEPERTTRPMDAPTTTQKNLLNGIDVDALREKAAAIQKDPALGRTRWNVTTRWKGGTRSDTSVTSYEIGGQRIAKDFTIQVDEPLELLGTNRFANPQEVLLAALNACMTVGYTAAFALEGVRLKSLRIETSGDIDLRGFLGLDASVKPGYEALDCVVHVEADATPEEIERVHDTVGRTSPNLFNVTQSIRVRSRIVAS